jgi:2-methylfumaryl-CoA isomerase
VLTNADRPWLSYEALSTARQDLIHVRIDGLHGGKPAVDYTVNASTGFPLVTGPEGHAGPVNHVLPAWDVACGLYAAIAILGAERQRRLTGAGQQISVALDDVALATAGNLGFLAEAEVNGVSRPRVGNHLYGSFARDFATRDGRLVMVVALTGRHWADLLAATGLQGPVSALEQALGVDFSTEDDRFTYRDSLAGLLQRWFGDHELQQVRAALAPASTLWSVYRSFRDLVQSDDLRANPLTGIIDQPGVGRYHAPASPIAAGPAGDRVAVRAPLLGEDTEKILRADLGISDDTIKELLERGVVATASPSRR